MTGAGISRQARNLTTKVASQTEWYVLAADAKVSHSATGFGVHCGANRD